jgi:anti-sigma B factor antagonist
MDAEVHYSQQCVHVIGEMTVYTCSALKQQLLAELTQHPDANLIELAQVTEIDTAGLQILLMARRHASALGRNLRLVNPSHAVTEVLELCRLGALVTDNGPTDFAANTVERCSAAPGQSQ